MLVRFHDGKDEEGRSEEDKEVAHSDWLQGGVALYK